MGCRSDSIAISRDMGPLRQGVECRIARILWPVRSFWQPDLHPDISNWMSAGYLAPRWAASFCPILSHGHPVPWDIFQTQRCLTFPAASEHLMSAWCFCTDSQLGVSFHGSTSERPSGQKREKKLKWDWDCIPPNRLSLSIGRHPSPHVWEAGLREASPITLPRVTFPLLWYGNFNMLQEYVVKCRAQCRKSWWDCIDDALLWAPARHKDGLGGVWSREPLQDDTCRHWLLALNDIGMDATTVQTLSKPKLLCLSVTHIMDWGTSSLPLKNTATEGGRVDRRHERNSLLLSCCNTIHPNKSFGKQPPNKVSG